MISPDLLTLFPADQDLLGEKASDLVGDDIKVYADGSVTGTFHYVTGFTGFSSVPEEQVGYYFPFHLVKTGTKMTFRKNGLVTKQDIAFDPDIIFRVTKDDVFEVLIDGISGSNSILPVQRLSHSQQLQRRPKHGGDVHGRLCNHR